jgi:hypothetical protein
MELQDHRDQQVHRVLLVQQRLLGQRDQQVLKDQQE